MDSTGGDPRMLFIKGGTVVNADKTEEVDLLIDNGVIIGMDYDLEVPEGAEVISAEGLLVIPGGIDPHTHLEFEFMGTKSVDDFYHGTKAAIAGGTTMIIDFAIAKPGQSLIEEYDIYRKMADGKVCCDYGLHIGLTYWSENVAKEMEILCSQHGINSYKLFMAYKDMFMVDDGELYDAFSRCKELGAIAMVHAENGHIIEKNAKKLKAAGITGPEGHELSRPEDVEAEATNRAAMIAGQVDAPLYVVHVMSDAAAQIIADRRAAGQTNLYGETLAAALGTVAPERHCDFHIAAAHVMSPPIRRDPNNPNALMNRLASNGLQTTATDNCTFNKDQKALGKGDFSKIPNGVNGLEDRLSIVWHKGVVRGVIDPQKFVEITSTNAAKIFNLYPKKGCIEVGSDADIVLWDPKKVRTISAQSHHHACDFNIFEGLTVQGAADTVIVKGKVCYHQGQLKSLQGHGSYVQCPVFPPYVFAKKSLRRSSVGSGDHLRPVGQTSPSVLNFQERQLFSSAIGKAANKIVEGSLKSFQEFDSGGSGTMKKAAFNKVLHTLGILQELSSREFEALARGVASYKTPVDFEVDYNSFIRLCNNHKA